MYAALSWVPRGAGKAKLPEGLKDDDEMDVTAAAMVDRSRTESQSDDDVEVEEEEDSEVDIGQILANDLDTLSFHKKNEEDPYLKSDPKASELFDEDELEDLVIRPTDALIVAAKSGDDASTLEVHLFDDDPDASDSEEGPYVPHTYVHHDLVLPVLPLCTAYTNLSMGDEFLNLVAVGMFTPGIEIWDIDRVNNLEPIVSLGGYERQISSSIAAAAAARRQKKKKKKPKLRLKEHSHKDAVMCLSWNNVQREYLASGSADCAVKIWDIESAHCASTLGHHSDKVQAVAFHPSKAEVLLSGSFDKTVHLVDVRDPDKNLSWSVETDVESCQWGAGPSAGLVVVTTEDGFATVFDPRKSQVGKSNSHLTRWRAHKGAASASSVSQDVPGLMVTGGVDKMVRVWDVSSVVNGNPGELVFERPSKAGALFALSLCPLSQNQKNTSPFVIAFGGAQGALRVADLAVESQAVRDRFIRHCLPMTSKAIMRRAARRKQTATAGGKPVGESDNVDCEDSDSSESESDHET